MMNHRSARKGWIVFGTIAALLPSLWATPGTRIARDTVVVLANEAVPEGVAVARHYIAVRGIPESNLIVLPMPTKEGITRSEYNDLLRTPLLGVLKKRGLFEQKKTKNVWKGEKREKVELVRCQVRCIVPVFGVPLRVEDTTMKAARALSNRTGGDAGQKRNEASVDSELSCLFLPGSHLKAGWVGQRPNPYFGVADIGPASVDVPVPVVSRLDGPTADIAKVLVDSAVAAERVGLMGRAVVDMQGLRGGGYLVGDLWMHKAAITLQMAGLETELDQRPPSLELTYPLADAILYLGWYDEHITPLFKQESFRFVEGAVAYHLHSFSAFTLRSTTKGWVGPLLAKGATATMGHVAEPYLPATPNLDLFIDRLVRGHCFGDSAMMAIPSLSWQVVLVGDPLYTPFLLPLAERQKNAADLSHPLAAYGHVQRVNREVRAGALLPAMDYLRWQITQKDDPVLREKLGDLYAANRMLKDAVGEYHHAVVQAKSGPGAVRAGAKGMLMARHLGQEEVARKIQELVRTQWPNEGSLPWLEGARPKGSVAPPQPAPVPEKKEAS